MKAQLSRSDMLVLECFFAIALYAECLRPLIESVLLRPDISCMGMFLRYFFIIAASRRPLFEGATVALRYFLYGNVSSLFLYNCGEPPPPI